MNDSLQRLPVWSIYIFEVCDVYNLTLTRIINPYAADFPLCVRIAAMQCVLVLIPNYKILVMVVFCLFFSYMRHSSDSEP